MTDLEAVIVALGETLAFWEPDDNVSRFAESLRRNLEARAGAQPAEDPF